MYETFAILISGPFKILFQFIKNPANNIAKEYPIAITIAEILFPLGKVTLGFSVASAKPPTLQGHHMQIKQKLKNLKFLKVIDKPDR